MPSGSRKVQLPEFGAAHGEMSRRRRFSAKCFMPRLDRQPIPGLKSFILMLTCIHEGCTIFVAARLLT